jgi:hypothetical protein
MGRTHDEFLKSSIAKVTTLINIHMQFKTGKFKNRYITKEVSSMHEISGLI